MARCPKSLQRYGDGRGIFVAFLLMAILGACDDFRGIDQVAVTMGRDRTVVVHYAGCPDEEVRSVKLVAPREEGPGVSTRERVLWRVVKEGEGSSPDTFKVGTTPAGYRELVPLDQEIRRRKLTVYVDSNRQEFAYVTFRLDDLSSGTLLGASGEFSSVEEFRETALREC